MKPVFKMGSLESYLLEDERLKSDLWGFGKNWSDVVEKMGTIEALYAALTNRIQKIHKVKEKYRPFIQDLKRSQPLYDQLTKIASITADTGTYYINKSQLSLIPDGISGSYFWHDEKGSPRFVVKPLDEEPGAIHNPKKHASPFKWFQPNFPLYDGCREVLAYQVALTIGTQAIAPKTVLAILNSDRFHDLSEEVSLSELSRYRENCGESTDEKLCSVQEFIPNSKSLMEALQDFQMAGLSDDEIALRINQDDFEDANLLIWTTFDNDAHAGNFLVYVKEVDPIGNEILGLKKIDNGFAFPEKNRNFRNQLSYLPNADRPLSDLTKAKIARLDVERLADQCRAYGLESAIPALRQRIPVLKELAGKPGITIREINKLMTRYK